MKTQNSADRVHPLRRVAILGIAVLAIALVGCGSETDSSAGDDVSSDSTTLTNEDDVTNDSMVDPDGNTDDDLNVSTEDGTEEDGPVPGTATYEAAKAEVDSIISADSKNPCVLYEASNVLLTLPEPETPAEYQALANIVIKVYSTIASILDDNDIDSSGISELVETVEKSSINNAEDLAELDTLFEANESAESEFDQFSTLAADCAGALEGGSGTPTTTEG